MNKTHFVLGGDLKKSLTEGYTLNFQQLFKDSFAITRKHFLSLFLACFTAIAIVALLITLSFDALSAMSDANQSIVIFIFSIFVGPPLMAGLQMMGIHHAIGIKSRPIDLFNCFNILPRLALASVIINIIASLASLLLSQLFGNIGLQLTIVVMLYLNMTFCMVYALIAEKRISPQLAIRLSFKLVNKNLRQFTLLFIFLGLLGAVAILPSGLGLIFFIPFYFNLMGIVYRQLCGVGVVATEISEKEGDNDGSDDQPPHDSDDKNNTHFEA